MSEPPRSSIQASYSIHQLHQSAYEHPKQRNVPSPTGRSKLGIVLSAIH